MIQSSSRSILNAHCSSARSINPYSFFHHSSIVHCNTGSGPRRPTKLKDRSPDQQRWLQRHFKDPYVIRSKLDNYRARSAYKLLEIDDKYRFLQPGLRVVDCGAAPGSWTQVAVERVNARGVDKKSPIGRVVAVDKIHLIPIDGALMLGDHDFTKPETRRAILQHFASSTNEIDGGGFVDVVLSDMAPSRTSTPECDHERIIELCYQSLVFAIKNLSKGGVFLTKLWDGYLQPKLTGDISKHFQSVAHIKPDSSRDDSAEMFLLGRMFKGIKRSE